MLDQPEEIEQALPKVYLLTIRGNLLPPTLEMARNIHNETAGAPPSVAAARSLGDLSHMVYVPTERPKSGAGELLFLDLWNSMNGLNQFFANPQVQEQGGRIFRTRDPVVWAPAEGFNTYHLPAPASKTDRIVAIVRGMVRSRAEARRQHNALLVKQVSKSRMAGNMSHEAYFKLAPPGTPETLEFLAVDVWMNTAEMNNYYRDPEFQRSFQELFTASPTTSAWSHPNGEWVEW
jgi:quinol monooxygenase YgiN